MKIVALYHLKGGVGKSVSAVNLAVEAAQKGPKTLLWDLDPQGASAWYLGIDNHQTGGMKKLWRGKTVIGDLIQKTSWPHLDVIAGGLSTRHLEEDPERLRQLLTNLFSALSEDYAWLFLDCSAGFNHVNNEIMRQANLIVAPMIPTSLSIQAYHLMIRQLAKLHIKKPKLHPFLTLVDKRRRLHRELCQQLPEKMTTLMKTMIPYASIIEQMGLHRTALLGYAKHSYPAQQYHQLFQEINEILLSSQ